MPREKEEGMVGKIRERTSTASVVQLFRLAQAKEKFPS